MTAPPRGASEIGGSIHDLMRRLYPMCRSITGDGVRQTLAVIKEYIPLEVYEVPTGTQVFDWTVPREWNIRDAYVKNAKGERVIDFKQHSLHVVNYSTPVRQRMSLAELRPYLHTLPDHPDWIPYRASYYKDSWGFCLTERQLDAMPDGEYDVCIDSTLEPGSLTYGECLVPGESQDEVLIYTHVCHPSLCNDNLSGVALVTHLAQAIAAEPRRRLSYRFVFAPTTIGSITWLSQNESRLGRIKHGLVVTLVGDPGHMTYKKSRAGDALVDRAVQHVLKTRGQTCDVIEFSPYGYDERQFCSPGINLPVGRLTRTPNACYPEYHTSADNLDLVRPESLADSFAVCRAVLRVLDGDGRYLNQSPKCEPQLGRRGVYKKTSADRDVGQRDMALLWVLNFSDGRCSLLDIAARAGLSFDVVAAAAADLVEVGLLRAAGDREGVTR